MTWDILAGLASSGLQAGTVLLWAALGELLLERSGVINLGLEGVMLVGAVAGFAGAQAWGPAWGVVSGAMVGLAAGLVHGVGVVVLRGNQVVAGLAMVMVGTGLSGLWGARFVGVPGRGLGAFVVSLPRPLAWARPLLGQDALVYAGVLLVALASWFLRRTAWGLALRAVGENPTAAYAQGISVTRVRLVAAGVAGLMAGMAGAYLSVGYARMWVERMVAGRGWIALAVVIFSSWSPWRVLAGAYLFGFLGAASFRLQTLGIGVSAPVVLMLPYAGTVAAVALMGWRTKGRTVGPSSLSRPFHPEARE